MYKFLISFIVFILSFAFIVGQCNNSEEDFYTEDIENIDDNNAIEKEVVELNNDNVQESQKYQEDICLENQETQSSADGTSSTKELLEKTLPEAIENPLLMSNVPSQIIERKSYTISYNNYTKNANWVAWNLTKDKTDGPWSRRGIDYMEDDDIIGPKQELSDWNNHGLPIDHGHLCPAGDNKWDRDAMLQTFYLSNMCPQNSRLNRGEWERLESRCRGWANHYEEIFIVAGPLFDQHDHLTIGKNKVGVPNAFYKVVLRLGKKPAALGFIFPNESTQYKMQHYVLSVDEVEERTKIDFFNNLPDELENEIESVSDFSKW